jgi:hypothetical protein
MLKAMLNKHPKMFTYGTEYNDLTFRFPSPVDIYQGNYNVAAYLNYSSEN